MQFVERAAWVPAFHIHYHLGMDGISIPFILLTTLMTVLVVLLYSEAGSFAVLDLHALPLGLTAQKLVFLAFLVAFEAVRGGGGALMSGLPVLGIRT